MLKDLLDVSVQVLGADTCDRNGCGQQKMKEVMESGDKDRMIHMLGRTVSAHNNYAMQFRRGNTWENSGKQVKRPIVEPYTPVPPSTSQHELADPSVRSSSFSQPHFLQSISGLSSIPMDNDADPTLTRKAFENAISDPVWKPRV